MNSRAQRFQNQLSDEERRVLYSEQASPTFRRVVEIAKAHRRGEPFAAQWLVIASERDQEAFLRMRNDPHHFSDEIFDGRWWIEGAHPEIGEIRIIRAITDDNAVSHLIGRQGEFLYASSWPR